MPPRVDPAAPAAIIIFGAGLRPDGSPSPTLAGRVRAALRLGQILSAAGDAASPLYIPTGGVGRHGPSEAAAMAAMLREHGIAKDRVVLEDTAHDTLASALACAAILRSRRHRGSVYAASSAYHLPRCVLLLRLAGIAARPAPPPPMPASSRWRKRWYWRLREVPAIPWDAMLMLLAVARRPGAGR